MGNIHVKLYRASGSGGDTALKKKITHGQMDVRRTKTDHNTSP